MTTIQNKLFALKDVCFAYESDEDFSLIGVNLTLNRANHRSSGAKRIRKNNHAEDRQWQA